MKKTIEPKFINPTTLRIGPVRLCYTHLNEPHALPGTDPSTAKYQTSFLVDKRDKKTIEAINKAIENAKQRGITSVNGKPTVWGTTIPARLRIPFQDGDERERGEEEFKGFMYANANAKRKPVVVDKKCAPILDPDEIYSGMWAVLVVSFFPYNNAGNKGVGCGLENVMKTSDGERIGGGALSAQAAFDGLDMSEIEDEEEDY